MLKTNAVALARKRLETAFKTPIMEPPPGVTFRGATEEDFDGVMEFTPNIYNISRGLPDKYITHLRDPKRYSYVAVKNEKVIAYTYNYVVDGGTSIYGGGARRHPEFKGHGVWKALMHYSLVDTLVTHPSVRKIRAAIFGMESKLPRYETELKLIPGSTVNYISIAKCVPRNELKVINTSDFGTQFATRLGVDKADVKFASLEDLKEIFTNPSLVKKVFPGSIIHGVVDKFEPLVVNLPELFQKHKAITISKDGLSVAVAEYYQAPNGPVFDLSVHGEASAELAMAHFLRFAEGCLDKFSASGPLSIAIRIPDIISKERFTNLCKRLPFYRGGNLYDVPKIMVYEMPIPDLARL